MLGHKHARQLLAGLVALAVLFVPSEAIAVEAKPPVDVGGPQPPFTFSSSISPLLVSRKKRSPIKLSLLSQFFPTERTLTYPPALAQEKLLLDRHLELSTLGLPACSVGLQIYPSVPVPERCAPALVGTGKAKVTIALSEEMPVQLDLKVHLYNGDTRAGVTKLWLYFPITVPVPASVLAPIEIRKVDQGAYGTEALISMPKIAGGAGFFTQLSLEVNHTYEFKGQPRSVATFHCANGKFQFSAAATFLDGSQVTAPPAVRACGVKR